MTAILNASCEIAVGESGHVWYVLTVKSYPVEQADVDYLLSLKPDLDIFDAQDPDHELIQLEFFPALPITPDVLIWGHHIVKTAKAIGKQRLPCRRIREADSLSLLKIALKLESRKGGYTWMERAKILDFLTVHAGSWDAAAISPLVDGKIDFQWEQKVRDYQGLHPRLQEMVNCRVLDLKTSLTANNLPPEVIDLVFKHRRLLTFSERRILITFLAEISRRDKASTREAVEFAVGIFQAAQPIDYVRRIRYPVLTEMESQFQTQADRLLAGTGIHLKAPPFFEGDAYTVSFDVASKENFREKMNVLKRLQEQFGEFLDLLR